MARRSKSIQTALDVLNNILVEDNLIVTEETGYLKQIPSNSQDGIMFKQGVCEAIEILLHKSNCYRGFYYLTPDKGSEYSNKFTRKYL